MPVHADSIDVATSHPLRWLLVPVVGLAVLTAAARLWRRRAQPRLEPMSNDWLRTHEAVSGRSFEP